jgi:hypothetical protein
MDHGKGAMSGKKDWPLPLLATHSRREMKKAGLAPLASSQTGLAKSRFKVGSE